MTSLKYEAIQLVEQMPEDQIPSIVQYLQKLKSRNMKTKPFDPKSAITPKMKAFMELEGMLIPVSPQIDYDRELAEAREEKYGHFD